MTDRERVSAWARERLEKADFIVLDTETTGLEGGAEVIQIGILSARGDVLLDCLVRPYAPIPPEATAIHGITQAQVEGAPIISAYHQALVYLFAKFTVLIYNAEYDCRLIRQSFAATGTVPAWTQNLRDRSECVMRRYAEWLGERKWRKLPGGDHSAIGDCRATLAVLREMAGEGGKEEGGRMKDEKPPAMEPKGGLFAPRHVGGLGERGGLGDLSARPLTAEEWQAKMREEARGKHG